MTSSDATHWTPDPTEGTRAQRLRAIGAVFAVVAAVGAAAVSVTLPHHSSTSPAHP